MADYFCKNCNCGLDIDDLEKQGKAFTPDGEYLVCPHCHSGDDLVEGGKCSFCGEDMEYDSSHLCEECKNVVIKKWKAFQDTLTEDEWDYLFEVIHDDE